MLGNLFFLSVLAAVGYAGDYEPEGCLTKMSCLQRCADSGNSAVMSEEMEPLLIEEQQCSDVFVSRIFANLPKHEDFQACTGIVLTYRDGEKKRCTVPQSALKNFIQANSTKKEPLLKTYYHTICTGVIICADGGRNHMFYCRPLHNIVRFLKMNSERNNWCTGDIPWDRILSGYKFCVVPEGDKVLNTQEITLTGVGTGWSLYGWKDAGCHPLDENDTHSRSVMAKMLREGLCNKEEEGARLRWWACFMCKRIHEPEH